MAASRAGSTSATSILSCVRLQTLAGCIAMPSFASRSVTSASVTSSRRSTAISPAISSLAAVSSPKVGSSLTANAAGGGAATTEGTATVWAGASLAVRATANVATRPRPMGARRRVRMVITSGRSHGARVVDFAGEGARAAAEQEGVHEAHAGVDHDGAERRPREREGEPGVDEAGDRGDGPREAAAAREQERAHHRVAPRARRDAGARLVVVREQAHAQGDEPQREDRLRQRRHTDRGGDAEPDRTRHPELGLQVEEDGARG